MKITTPQGRPMADDEARQLLRSERLGLEQRRLALRKQRASMTEEIDAISRRLGDIRFAFGLLGGE